MLERKQPAKDVSLSGGSSSILEDNIASKCCSQLMKRSLQFCGASSSTLRKHQDLSSGNISEGFCEKSSNDFNGTEEPYKSFSTVESNKKARKSQLSQLSLNSYFKRTVGVIDNSDSICADKKLNKAEMSCPRLEVNETFNEDAQHDAELQSEQGPSIQEDYSSQPSEKERNGLALVEWQRIQQFMQTSIPLCKGHKEPCVPRVVKKPGPNIGRRFYVCARAEVSLSCYLVFNCLASLEDISYLNPRRSSTHPIDDKKIVQITAIY